MATKSCSKCKVEKDIGQYYKLNCSKDGLSYQCKICANVANRRQYDKYYKAGGAKHRQFKKTYNDTMKGKYSHLKHTAKIRGLEMNLTLEDFSQIRQGDCSYCGFALPRVGHGLDRLNNSLGYIKGNLTPCCVECNVARSDHFTPVEMKIIGAAISQIKVSRRQDI